MKNETSITRSWRKPSLISAALELFPLRETLRFLITGLLATLTHAAVGYTLISTTEMLGPMANICGFLSAWWISFMGYFYFSFRGHEQGWAAARRFVAYSAMIFAMAHSLTVFVSASKVLGDELTPIVGAVLTSALSFVVYKFIVRNASSVASKIGVVTALPPSCTTLNEYGLHLANAFLREDEVAEVVAIADMTNSPKVAETASITIDRCWKFNGWLTPLSILKSVRQHRPDVVVFNAHMASFGDRVVPAALGLLSIPLLKMAGFKTGVILHNVLGGVNLEHTSMRGHPFRKAMINLFGKLVLRQILRADYLTVTLREYKDLLADAGHVQHVTPVAHGSFEISREIDYPVLTARPRRVVTFGKFGTYKKLDNLIAAVRILRDRPEFADVELVIGGGNHQSAPGYIESMMDTVGGEKGIRYLGYIAEGEVAGFFHGAQVTVFDYTATTGSSGALNQAVSYGSVPIFPDIEDFTRVCSDEAIDGVHFPPGDVVRLVGKLTEVLGEPAMFQKLVDQNFAANRSFTIQDVAHFHVEKMLKLRVTSESPAKAGVNCSGKRKMIE